MKVFVHQSELAKNNPQILAAYPDESDVRDDAHGTGVMVFQVSADALVSVEVSGMRMPALAGDWRQRSERAGLFSPRDRLKSLHELIQLIIKNGSDVNTWPAPDKDRYAAIEKRWAP